MPYFTAVVVRAGGSWRARDVDVDDAGSLDELADTLRSVALDEEPVLAVVEHEDEWFALIRVDGDEEPRLFVSDLPAAAHSSYAELLASAADVEVEDDVEPPAPAEAESDDDDEDDDEDAAEPAEPEPRLWAGEPDLLEDLGVNGRTLRGLVQDNGGDPAAVLAELGDQVGFGGLLAALR